MKVKTKRCLSGWAKPIWCAFNCNLYAGDIIIMLSASACIGLLEEMIAIHLLRKLQKLIED